jgi:hypothetical protein
MFIPPKQLWQPSAPAASGLSNGPEALATWLQQLENRLLIQPVCRGATERRPKSGKERRYHPGNRRGRHLGAAARPVGNG